MFSRAVTSCYHAPGLREHAPACLQVFAPHMIVYLRLTRPPRTSLSVGRRGEPAPRLHGATPRDTRRRRHRVRDMVRDTRASTDQSASGGAAPRRRRRAATGSPKQAPPPPPRCCQGRLRHRAALAHQAAPAARCAVPVLTPAALPPFPRQPSRPAPSFAHQRARARASPGCRLPRRRQAAQCAAALCTMDHWGATWRAHGPAQLAMPASAAHALLRLRPPSPDVATLQWPPPAPRRSSMIKGHMCGQRDL